MVKKKLSCNCDCHTVVPVAAEETAAPKAKSRKSAKGKSPAQVKHQARFGLVAKLKKEHADWTNEKRWDEARKQIP